LQLDAEMMGKFKSHGQQAHQKEKKGENVFPSPAITQKVYLLRRLTAELII